MIAGAVLTAIIQSSSASVGILQALCATGAITYGTAIPIIMGQNIGTCVTAMISSVGANKNAKRAAFVHLYFNVLGTVLFMLIFYGIQLIVPFSFLTTACNVAGIAVIHSLFNIAATIIFLPFVNQLVWLACKTVREVEDDEEEVSTLTKELQLLDVRFLDAPALAVQHCYQVTVKMGELAKRTLEKSFTLLDDYKEEEVKKVLRLEDVVDQYENQLNQYMIQISSQNLSEKDSYLVSLLLHSIGDLERISDHAVNVMESAKEMHEKSMKFTEQALEEKNILCSVVIEILKLSLTVLRENDRELAKEVEKLEEVVDKICEEIKTNHICRLRKGECSPEMGVVLMDITTDLERVADHCLNLAIGL
jgi:phosphate:Na+ symporter